MDHESFLGDTLAKIAFEKAGILKPGVPAVVGPQRPEALAVIEARAAEIGAPLLVHGPRLERARHGDGGSWSRPARDGSTCRGRRLEGVHQIDNAGLAVMAALQLPEAGLSVVSMGRGLTEARWPARLQRLTQGPLIDLVPPGTTLWLDGGHNPAAGQVLADEPGHARPRPRSCISWSAC